MRDLAVRAWDSELHSKPPRESFCFLEEYEGTRTPGVSGRQLLRQLCLENAISGTALSKILGASRLLGSMRLRGNRNITAGHARTLGKHFKIDPGAFL